MNQRDEHYIPPLRYHWLTRFYDPIVQFTTREGTFRRALLQQVAPRPHDRVLDLGCGTASLSVALASQFPLAAVTGLDADARALAIARDKARRAGAFVHFEQGHSCRMPFPDGYFDRVVSSLFFHHLKTEDKTATLSEIRRVLRPDGQLHVADWGRPANALLRVAFLAVQMLDGFETTGDSVRGSLLSLIHAAGFTRAQETASLNAPLGTLVLYRAINQEDPIATAAWSLS